ncbi:DUF429 domain-containing protein [Halorubellus sp. PRR65]|uniref:DUF429 domain-containing protein n=1 Tax=Halorubellus sp. PRR65 TaxID=3098148 RepID=UPI002B261964|nr:DUF429 domain-containing protein [Halorubellus sp. PRR65]
MPPEHVAVGVDATPDGWVAVRYTDRTYQGVQSFADDEEADDSAFRRLVDTYGDEATILVDVPIGLPDEDPARDPERKARENLENRQSSVFNVPIREILDEDDYESANEKQREKSDKGLMRQTFNITHRVREVDGVLRNDHLVRVTQNRIREAHPEVCFWALNDRQDMQFSKSSQPAAAHWERVRTLEAVHSDAPDTFLENLRAAGDEIVTWDAPELSNDDLLDAFALAVTASTLTGEFETLPEDPSEDETGLTMEMVYASSN